MKKILLIFLFLSWFTSEAQLSWQGGTPPAETSSNPVLLFDATGTPLESYSGTIYAHTGVTIDGTTHWVNVIGTWGNNVTQPSLANVSGNIYSLTFTPTIQSFYSNPSGTITGIDIVLRSADGNTQTADLNINVGAFQLTLTSPTDNITLLTSGQSLSIAASTSLSANFVLKANGTTINTSNGSNNL